MVDLTSLVFALTVLGGHANAVRFLGRVNPATRELTWPGTGVSFNFTGKSASIGITAINGDNSADLYIDDAAPIVIPNIAGTSINTPSNLTYGTHIVVLRRRSETALGTFSIGAITAPNGTFGTDEVPSRRIEFIGDSITVGYGLDGELPCVNTAALENNPLTYAALAAESLNADYTEVAWSGKGVTRNYVTPGPDPSPIMPELYTRWGANDADNSYPFANQTKPDAVVINLGTNDFSYLLSDATGASYAARPILNATAFTAATVAFVQSIKKNYGSVPFFLMTSPMLNDGYPSAAEAQHTTHQTALEAVIAQLGNSTRIELVEWPAQGSVVGCDYHPTAATHAAEAPILAAAIKKTLKW